MYANKVKKVVAVHDLSGVGRVSLTVVIPILSSMGFQVCPLPTAVLSSHTQYPEFSFLDLTDEMPKIISEWKKIHCHAAKKILYLFTFPLFMFTYVPISIYALFAKVEWKPIIHKPVAKNSNIPVSLNGAVGEK